MKARFHEKHESEAFKSSIKARVAFPLMSCRLTLSAVSSDSDYDCDSASVSPVYNVNQTY